MSATTVSLDALFIAFLKVALGGFGSCFVWARRIAVEQRQWISEEEFSDIGAFLPSTRRPTARLWRDGPVEQHMLAWTPVCRFRHAWMRTPDFALSSGEPGA